MPTDLELLNAPDAAAAPDTSTPAASPTAAPDPSPADAAAAAMTSAPAAPSSPAGEAGVSSAPDAAVSAPSPDAAPDSAVAPAESASPSPAANFSAALAEDSALQQALARHPGLQSALESALQQNSQWSEWQRLFPSLDAARYAAAQSDTLAGFDRLYYSNQPEAARELLLRLYHNQFLRDPESGELMRDAAGEPISTGAYDRLATAWRDALLDALDRHAADGDAELASALQILRARLDSASSPSPRDWPAAHSPSAAPESAKSNSNSSSSPSSADSGAASPLPPEVRTRLDRLDALERQLESSEREQWRSWHDGLARDVSQTVRADIEQALAPAALPAYVKSKVIDDVLEGINRYAAADGAYQHRIQTLLRAAQAQSVPGAAHPSDMRNRILAAARAQARGQLAPIAQQVLRQALAGLRQEQEQRLAKVDEQRARVEIKGAGAAPAPVRRQDADRIRNAERSLGRRLSDREILDLT